jgi:S-(hydroxymethyl)glutathione dehydrogenase / alcohol dehydrogenase
VNISQLEYPNTKKQFKTTVAAVLTASNSLSIGKLFLPKLKRGQLLVSVAYSGLCGSQLLEVLGKRGEDKFLPHTLGHEGSGVVVKTGPGVSKVRVGDHVVLTWIKGKGAEVPSTQYKCKGKTINAGAISTLMTTMVTCENRVVAISKEMPLREAALLGCMIPTGAGIVFNKAKLKKNMSIAVFGVGGIGLGVVSAAVLAKANPIIAVDIHDHKLRFAAQAGATHMINASDEDPVARIHKITKANGALICVEAAGQIISMEQAVQATCLTQGLCVLAGNLAHRLKIKIDPFDLICGKKIEGTWGGETNPDRDIPTYVDSFLAGELNLTPLITNEYELDQINQAFDDLRAGRLGRGLVRLGTKSEGF